MTRIDHLPAGYVLCTVVGCGQPERAELAGPPRICRRHPDLYHAGLSAAPPEPDRVVFTVYGAPGQWRRTTGARTTDPRHAAWAAHVRQAAHNAVGGGVAYPDGPVDLTVTFVLLERSGRVHATHPHDPDLDNLLKLVLDAVTDIDGQPGAITDNDRNVIRIVCSKQYGPDPMTVIVARRPDPTRL